VLAAAVDTARNGILEIAGDTPVGEHLGAFPEAERLVTHRFAASVPGYVGWHWFATLARVPRGKEVTICEVGLLPSEEALLAPDWVPWSERVLPEDTAEETAEQEDAAPVPDAGGVPDADGGRDAGGTVDDDGVESDATVDGGGETEPSGAVDADGADEADDAAGGDLSDAGSEEQTTAEDRGTPGGESPVA
jgi:hypothetical protein